MSEGRFEGLVTFPIDFTFRVIARSSPDLLERCTTLLAQALGRAVVNAEHSVTKSGRWTAVHVTVHALDASELDACYAILGTLDGLQLVL
jgi:putative lipoic acid-binding regulatory protein